MSTVLSRDITWDITRPNVFQVGRAALSSAVSWNSADPIAVHVVFHDKNGSTPWQFARDLLYGALTDEFSRAVGECDIRIVYCDPVLIVSLATPSGSMTLQTDAALIKDFLERTIAIVPLGQEDYQAATEETIRKIMEDA